MKVIREHSVLALGGVGGTGVAAAVDGAGMRLLAHVPLDGAAARLDLQPDASLVLLLLAGHEDRAQALDLLDRVSAAATAGACRAVIVLAADLLDAASGPLFDGVATLLVDPHPLELAGALAMAAATAGHPVFHDVGKDSANLRLIELSEEVGRLARQLAQLAGDRDRPAEPAPVETKPEPVAVTAAHIRAHIRARRVRDQFFRADLFADPGWDILLDLAAARKEGQGVPVSSLCIAAAVPATTALRWIKALSDEGLLERRPDPADGRRVFVSLAEPAARAMDACLAAMRRTGAFDG